MGEAGLIEEGMRIYMEQRMMLLRPIPELMRPEYLLLALRAPSFLKRMHCAGVGATVKHLRVRDVESLWLPIPPVKEQGRIVAKAEELLALCEVLEEKLRARDEKAAKLAGALVVGTIQHYTPSHRGPVRVHN